MTGRSPPARAAAGLAAVLGLGCAEPAPRALDYGADECAHCFMTLADPRFSAQLVTRTGRTIPFDDVGCLGTFVATDGVGERAIHSLWVADFLAADGLVPVTEAVFLASDRVTTPMRYGIIAVRSGPSADSLRTALSATVLTWDAVVDRLRVRPGP